MSDNVCTGRCNARPRREAEDYARALTAWQSDMAAWTNAEPEVRGPEPARPAEPASRWMAGAPFWCLADAAEIRAALADLDQQMTLRLQAGDGHRGLDLNERVSSSPEPASPSPAHDQLDELVRWLRDWQNAYWTSQGWPTPTYRGESAPALTAVSAMLGAHLTGILAHPDYAVGFGTGVLSWHRELTAAAKTRPRRVSKQMRCPQCHLATLSQMEGEDLIECRNRDCGANRGGPTVMTVAEYEARAAELLPAAKQARPRVPHQSIRPQPHDDQEPRAAGPRGTSPGVRIDPDTMRLILDHPHRGPLEQGEFETLPWPACPRCGQAITVDYDQETVPGKEPLTVGARTLPAIPSMVAAKPTLWRCTGPTCGAGGGA